MDLYWDYLKIVVRILKELIGFPRSYIRIRLGILQGFHKDSKGYEACLDGCYEDCYKDSVMISMRILFGIPNDSA